LRRSSVHPTQEVPLRSQRAIFSAIFSFLLALSLVIAQLGGLMHALSLGGDAAGRSAEEQQLPGAEVCAKCLAFAAIEGAATALSAAVVPNGTYPPLRSHYTLPVIATGAAFYHSRAPPSRT
jgi:hypothetical protein